jgi:hypothetical protein
MMIPPGEVDASSSDGSMITLSPSGVSFNATGIFLLVVTCGSGSLKFDFSVRTHKIELNYNRIHDWHLALATVSSRRCGVPALEIL